MQIVMIGLSITSSWGNGHATTYRALVRELAARGHDVLFLERDVPWYASNRDMPSPRWGRTELYSSREELEQRFGQEVRKADVVIVGSFVPEGVAVGEWVIGTAGGIAAFYDIDTPVTLAKLERADTEYLAEDLIPQYDLYFSFTGGPTLERLAQQYGARRVRVLYCSVDEAAYHPEDVPVQWDLGYLGTYSADRQEKLDQLMLEPARRSPRSRMVTAGSMYPPQIAWPPNVTRADHLPPSEHRSFYNAQRFTLNVTRADMVRLGYSPSVRLFEAAACGVPIITDTWPGLETIFEIGEELLVASSADEVLEYLHGMSEEERVQIGRRGRERTLASHTGAHRAAEFESYIEECASEAMGTRKGAA